MKIIKEIERMICGIKYPLFAIIKNLKNENYCYYINKPWTSNIGDIMIYKSKSKSIILNKYTLSILSILYTILLCIIYYPISTIFILIYNYFDGARNFIRNEWSQNERYFNWCNIIIIIGFIIWIILK